MRQRDSTALRNLNFAHHLVFTAKTLLPKTRETTELMNRRLLQPRPGDIQDDDDDFVSETDERGRRRRGPFGPRDVQQVDRTMRSRPVAWVIGTSLAFEGVVLALAAWVFGRRDF